MTAADPTYSRRWLVLAVVGIAQLMVVLDATVVNIALPSVQGALRFSNGEREWIVTGYALAFGSLLPHGGAGSSLVTRVAQTSSCDHDVRSSAA
jgi:MFS family permease